MVLQTARHLCKMYCENFGLNNEVGQVGSKKQTFSVLRELQPLIYKARPYTLHTKCLVAVIASSCSLEAVPAACSALTALSFSD